MSNDRNSSGQATNSAPPMTRPQRALRLAQSLAPASRATCSADETHGTAVANPQGHESQGKKVLNVAVTGSVPYYATLKIEVPSDVTKDDLDDILQEIVDRFGAPRNVLSDEFSLKGDDLFKLELEVTEAATNHLLDEHPQHRVSRGANGQWVVNG